MNKKYVEYFKKGKLVIHCKTENEAKRLIKWCYENDMKWGYSDPYDTNFAAYENICYRYDDTISYANYNLYKNEGYTIVSFDEMFNNTFTKRDLKAGQLVKCRNTILYKVLPTVNSLVLVNSESVYHSINYINDDLKSPIGNLYDIMEVYDFPKYSADLLNSDIKYRELLWQREEVKEMTVEEISKELGYKVKIIGGDK